MPYHFKSSPELFNIHFFVDKYEGSSGDLDLFLTDVHSKIKAESIVKLLAEMKIDSKLCFFVPPGNCDFIEKTVLEYNYFIRIDAKNFRGAIDSLYKKGKVSVSDRAEIEQNIRGIEADLGLQNYVRQEISNAQADIIQELFSDTYFEAILSVAKDLKTGITLINAACSNFATCPNPHTVLSHVCRKTFAENKFDEDTKSQLIDNLATVAKCYYGQANLESAYKQNGKGLPSLQLQRYALLSSAKVKLLEKFGDLIDEIKFDSLLLLNTLAEGYCGGILPPDNILKVYDDYLRIKFLPHSIFIKLIALTLKEAGLSLSNLPIAKRVAIAKMYRDAWNHLEGSEEQIANHLTSEEYALCKNLYALVQTTRVDPTITPIKESISGSHVGDGKCLSVMKELKSYQKEISQSSFLGEKGFLAKNKMRMKIAHAVEKRLSPNAEGKNPIGNR